MNSNWIYILEMITVGMYVLGDMAVRTNYEFGYFLKRIVGVIVILVVFLMLDLIYSYIVA